ncbi:MAG TPA: CBS domain-containing protein, partial [Solirubrobacteraceae bacterium]|nr:CBS domain-containing protein [Solirubrobacteraceae bacterium]
RPMAVEILHLSSVVNSTLVDRDGDRLGRVEDLIARLGFAPHPPVTGVVARIARRQLFVPITQVADLRPGRVQLVGDHLSLQRFDRRAGELLLAKDLRARHLINLQGARLIRANEIELARVGGRWEVVGVDPSPRAALRRLVPRRLGQRIPAGKIVDWATIEPFVGHVPTARLRIPYRKLARLHPAQIADLVEQASHEEGEEIIEAVGQDRELEADVFEELDDHHQLEFIRERPDAQVAAVIDRMDSDDAADLISEIDQERRARILSMLPAAHRRRIETLLGYNPSTAGGLMSPDFLALGQGGSVAQAIELVRSSDFAPGMLNTVYLLDEDGRLAGSVFVVSLVRAGAHAALDQLVEREPVSVPTGADLPDVARMMADYNLVMLPVVDDDERVVGVITVDDVLELLLPAGWRRRYGVASD